MVSHPNLYPDDLVRLDAYGPQDRKLIEDALSFARDRHGEQRRVAGPLFITHPIAAAQFLIDECRAEPEVVMATLLHDTVEDTGTTLDEIEARFGETIRFLVDGATDVGKGDGAQHIADKDERMARTHEKISSRAAKDPRIWLIKSADRWHNLLTSGALRWRNQERLAREAIDFHARGLQKAGYARQADEVIRVARAVLERAEQQGHHRFSSRG